MKTHLAIYLLIIMVSACLLAACLASAPFAGENFVDFQSFVNNTRKAVASDYIGRPGVNVENTEEFDSMKAHILSMYDGVSVAHSFLENGQYVDCVPIDQQPRFRQQHSQGENAPRPGNLPAPDLPPEIMQGTHAQHQPSIVQENTNIPLKICHAGTIPMRRLTLLEMTRFRTLNDFLAKDGLKGDSGK